MQEDDLAGGVLEVAGVTQVLQLGEPVRSGGRRWLQLGGPPTLPPCAVSRSSCAHAEQVPFWVGKDHVLGALGVVPLDAPRAKSDETVNL